ncbi:Uncharacterized protein HZ326_2992 [Fusarium oxysporum f. sp. albedinis]|nr:Uncharacterized protein HZ326_2992 [Fusarium oxysporum f. sp. albedinis]
MHSYKDLVMPVACRGSYLYEPSAGNAWGDKGLSIAATNRRQAPGSATDNITEGCNGPNAVEDHFPKLLEYLLAFGECVSIVDSVSRCPVYSRHTSTPTSLISCARDTCQFLLYGTLT